MFPHFPKICLEIFRCAYKSLALKHFRLETRIHKNGVNARSRNQRFGRDVPSSLLKILLEISLFCCEYKSLAVKCFCLETRIHKWS